MIDIAGNREKMLNEKEKKLSNPMCQLFDSES